MKMGKTSTHCILILVLFSGPRMVSEAECNGIIKVSSESSGTIQSPNYGTVYGKRANCSWEFISPSGNKAFLLTLTVTKLKTFFPISGKKVCSGSYNLTINDAPAECTRYADTAYNSSYCIAYYSSSTCTSLASSKNCEVSQMASFPIPVTYISDGRTDTRLTLSQSQVWGFTMQHEYTECPPDTSIAIQQMATTTATTTTTTTTTAPQDSNANETTAREITQEQSLSVTSTAKEKTTYKTSTTNSEASSVGERTSEIAQTTSATSTLKLSKVSALTKNQSIATEETASSQVITKDNAHKSTATAFSAATNPETQKSKVILYSAAAGGGGVLIIVILVVTVICIRKRNQKNLPLNGSSENHELAEQQSQPHEVNHDTEVVQSEERTSELPTSSTVDESVNVTVPEMSVEEDDTTAYYTTMRGAAPIRHNPTVNDSASPCSGDNPNDSDGRETPYSIISGAASINQSDNEMYCTLDRQGQPEGVYTIMGETMPVNQSDQLVNSAESRSQMQQTVHDQSETNIEGALYSAVSNTDGKKTVRYQKTMVNNLLYDTAP